jgi:hypothetical protein
MALQRHPHGSIIHLNLPPVLCLGVKLCLGGAFDNVRISSAGGAKEFSPRFGQVA